MIYWKLFYTFFKIGLFNFGGGYAMVSFIQNEVVIKNSWLSNGQFADIVAVSQVTPGPVGINMATYTGYAAAGDVWGAVVATTAVCLPAFVLLLWLGKFLFKYQHTPKMEGIFAGLRPAVVGLIAAAALGLCNAANFTDYKSVLFFLAAFVLIWTRKAGPIAVLLLSACGGFLVY